MSIKSEREIVLRRMQEIETEAWVAMMNHPKLAKHLSLLKTPFTLEDAKDFVLIKNLYWETQAYSRWDSTTKTHRWVGEDSSLFKIKPS